MIQLATPGVAPSGHTGLATTATPGGTALLLDTSSSMAKRDSDDLLRRIDRLESLLPDALQNAPGARLVAFGRRVRELTPPEPSTPVRLPEPAGCTPLAHALHLIAGWNPRPARVVVISDGQPDDTQTALAAARALRPAVIDALFVGDPGDHAALRFMRTLALMGAHPGVSGARSLLEPKALATEIKALLAGPAR
jgi:Mg-chelatase subunit ChlD